MSLYSPSSKATTLQNLRYDNNLTGIVSLKGVLRVDGELSAASVMISSNLVSDGLTTFQKPVKATTIDVSNSIQTQGLATVTMSARDFAASNALLGTLQCSSSAVFQAMVVTSADVSRLHADDVEVGSNLVVRGRWELGQVTVGSNLDVRGNASVAGTFLAVGATFAGQLLANSNLAVGGDASVAGRLLANSNLAVGGDASVMGDTSVAGRLLANSNLDVKGDASFSGSNVNIHGNIFISNPMVIGETLLPCSIYIESNVVIPPGSVLTYTGRMSNNVPVCKACSLTQDPLTVGILSINPLYFSTGLHSYQRHCVVLMRVCNVNGVPTIGDMLTSSLSNGVGARQSGSQVLMPWTLGFALENGKASSNEYMIACKAV